MNNPYVLDSSVFIYYLRISDTIYTVPEVLHELKSENAKIILNILIGEGLRIESPNLEAVKVVMEKSKSTGDYAKLSNTDIQLLAKALELNAILVTDDYAIQNVAAHLAIKTQGILQKQIRKVLTWKRRCAGCGRFYEKETVCPVCGGEIKIKRARR
ncbi:MAG TPA: ribonuclease VapC [Candidatus Acidoferrum sp.]|nr:ribonuclease VapC [Candidatus Acidoferrum sp.]